MQDGARMMMVRTWWPAIALAAAGSPALADMSARYGDPREIMSISVETADNGDVRSEGVDPQSYFLWRGGQAYLVRTIAGGPEVMRVEDMAAAMAARQGAGDPELEEGIRADLPREAFVAGPPVTVNGRPGIPYRPGGKTRDKSLALVIGTDPALAPLGAAMLRHYDMTCAMLGAMMRLTPGEADPFAPMRTVLEKGAPLTYSGMDLRSVDHAPIPASRFALPAEPLSRAEIDRKLRTLPPGL
jgi:hypothetical protein